MISTRHRRNTSRHSINIVDNLKIVVLIFYELNILLHIKISKYFYHNTVFSVTLAINNSVEIVHIKLYHL